MKKLDIRIFGDPVLRKKAAPVTVFHKPLHEQIDNIAFTLENRPDGAALAAPQVGLLKRIIVISTGDEYYELVNPEILEKSGDQTGFEGCLSYPGFSGRVRRADYVKITYQDRNGRRKELERTGFMARCIQHEIDHLDGILFIDRMETGYLENDDTGAKVPLELARKIAAAV